MEDNYEPPAKQPSPSHLTGSGDKVQMVEERLQMYKAAHQVAVSSGDASKAKRLDRGIKVRQACCSWYCSTQLQTWFLFCLFLPSYKYLGSSDQRV